MSSLFDEKASWTPAKQTQPDSQQPPPKYSAKGGSLFADDDASDGDGRKNAAGTSTSTSTSTGTGTGTGTGTSVGWWQQQQKNNRAWLDVLALTALAAATRLYRISRSSFVVWDESHFFLFGAYYVNNTFYHDVHPPLAKMLIGLSEILTGFDGSFTAPSGAEYPANVNYTFMRVFNASFGIALAPMAYCTLLNLGCTANAALLGGLLVCFDNALCTISRFILLDAMLLCFTAMSALSLSGMYKHRKHPFTCSWWKWLFATGISLGCVASSKWVGLLSVALVGLYTVNELYDIFGMPETRAGEYAMHWIARIVALIAVPAMIYILCFKIHFALLYKSGPGDNAMDSLFQAGLEGSSLRGQPLDVAYGSKITLKSAVPGVGMLHSHLDTYPGGSKQQQITGYAHKDPNNDWIVSKIHGQSYGNTTDTLEFLKDGDVVRLLHGHTSRNLHSHQVNAPISKREWEVTGYGIDSTYPDGNDHWRVEVVEELSRNNPERRVRTLTTRFRLRHTVQNCVLRVSGKSLPQWGWRQAEVVCDRHNKLDENAVWNVENHVNSLMPPAKPGELKGSFWRDFVNLNIAMARSNNALLPDEDKHDPLASTPFDWPIMRLGLRMCAWGDDRMKFWLVGNPVVWLTSSLATFILGPAQLLYYAVRRQRGLSDFKLPGDWDDYLHAAGILWSGWALHYLPFFSFGRVLYMHHYFPALYFAAMYLAYFIEWTGRRCTGSPNSYAVKVVLASLGVAAIANFMYFAPFTFGFDYPAKQLANRKWISSWNIYN